MDRADPERGRLASRPGRLQGPRRHAPGALTKGLTSSGPASLCHRGAGCRHVVLQHLAYTNSTADALRFGIANKPTWADFDIVSGRLSGTPTDANAGAFANIVISVSDGKLSATLPAYTLNVVKPVIGSADLTWTAPTQNDDGSALTNLAGYKMPATAPRRAR